MAGDLAALRRGWNVTLFGERRIWTLSLTPLSAPVAQYIETVLIEGRQDQIDRIEIRQADGVRSVMQIEPCLPPGPRLTSRDERQGRLTLLVWLALIAIAAWQAARRQSGPTFRCFCRARRRSSSRSDRAAACWRPRAPRAGRHRGRNAEERAQARARWPGAARGCAVHAGCNGDGQSLQATAPSSSSSVTS